MEDNYIMLNGRKVPLTEEQVAELLGGKTTGCAKVDPFERKIGEKYFFIGINDDVREWTDLNTSADEIGYNHGNYCRDKELMEQRALHETLNRLLWRYSEQHGGDADWITSNVHFFIVRHGVRDPEVSSTRTIKIPGVVYFASEEAAEGAIKDIVLPFMVEHHGLMW